MAVAAVLIAAAMLLGQINAAFGELPFPHIEAGFLLPLFGHPKLCDVAVEAAIGNMQARPPVFNTIYRPAATPYSVETHAAAVILSAEPAARLDSPASRLRESTPTPAWRAHSSPGPSHRPLAPRSFTRTLSAVGLAPPAACRHVGSKTSLM